MTTTTTPAGPAGIMANATAAQALAILREVLPYAENEAQALQEAARRDDDDTTAAEAATAWHAIERARELLDDAAATAGAEAQPEGGSPTVGRG